MESMDNGWWFLEKIIISSTMSFYSCLVWDHGTLLEEIWLWKKSEQDFETFHRQNISLTIEVQPVIITSMTCITHFVLFWKAYPFREDLLPRINGTYNFPWFKMFSGFKKNKKYKMSNFIFPSLFHHLTTLPFIFKLCQRCLKRPTFEKP